MLLVVRACRAATRAWPWVPRGHSLNPAKKLSKSQAPPRPRPPATQSPGVPALYWQIGPTMPLGPGPNSWLSFQAAVPRGLSFLHSSLETPEPNPRTPSDIQKETVPFRAVELFRPGEMGMPPPSQATPTFSAPIGQNMDANTQPDPLLNSDPGKFPCTGALSGTTWAQLRFPYGRYHVPIKKAL